MQSRIRREALRAVAKVALGAMPGIVLAGCGGKADLAQEGANAPTSASPAAPPGKGAEPDAACALPADVRLTQEFPRTATFTKAELGCCVARLEKSTNSNGEPPVTDTASTSCCNAVILAVDTGMLGFSDVTGEVRYLCCFSDDDDDERRQALWEHTFCSPWGPPVPPAMDWAVGGVA